MSVDSYLLNEILKSHHHMGENILKNAKEKVPSGIDAKTYLEEGTPSTTIVNFAKKNNVDLIIMGTRGLGSIQSALLGSVSQDVIHYNRYLTSIST
ncbi:universal stress protein [Anaerosinus gibii]|uniref:Universal stress protein n=1 Tax=Selenobaculum gibii TaxID=3054208 RepID=A0A9Y2ETB8_9FIRM|nr:universal stress protein [Selenobaculum gbiensis]